MSTPQPPSPGAERFIQLYKQGVSFNKMADDPELLATMLAGVDSQRTRSFKCYYKAETLCEMGVLERRKERRERKPSGPKPASRPRRLQVDPHDVETREDGGPGYRTPFQEALDQYEAWIGAPRKTTPVPFVAAETVGRQEWIVISDLHVPDHRMDLLARIAEEHRGKQVLVAGDLNDFESWGRWPVDRFSLDNLRSVFAAQDAILEFLDRNFSRTRLMLGNHDRRPWVKAGRALGPDYGWLVHEVMMGMLKHRHGIELVDHKLEKLNGRHVTDLHFYEQIGDCIISHAEVCGAPVASGSVKAHAFFQKWRRQLGLLDWNVLLQAHVHKTSHHRDRTDGTHLFEIGALCDTPEYALKGGRHCYGPTEHGYFVLVQYDGVTDLNESRLVCLD